MEPKGRHAEPDGRDGMRTALVWKALAYRVIAIAFTALFTGWSKSVEIHVGLTLIYYLFDLAWERRRIQPARSQHHPDPAGGSGGRSDAP